MLTKKEKLLGDALCGVLVAVGILDPSADPTGPELLLITNEYTEHNKKMQSDAKGCRCFKFYPGQNRFSFCPDCGRDLRAADSGVIF